MKTILLTLSLLFCSFLTWAQYKVVAFDYERATFNENQALPAETHMMLQGDIPESVVFVELDVLDAKGRKQKTPLYTAKWKRPFDTKRERFNLPINYKLRGSSEYDFTIRYYEPISDSTRQELTDRLFLNLDLYIEQALGVKKNKVQFNSSIKQTMKDLDAIVVRGLKHYRNRTAIEFEGFSDIIYQKLEQIKGLNLSKGRFLFNKKKEKKEKKDKITPKKEYRNKVIGELKSMLYNELEVLMKEEWSKISDSKTINDYSTEKIKRTIALQGGFGGVYLDGNSSGVSIGTAPYLGLSFPLGRKAFAPKFLSNLSVTAGAFILDFNDSNGNKVSGPIFKRPTYVGLSYKVFRFVRINAGATFLQDASTAGQLTGLGQQVFIRPNIGLSLQLNLWMDLAK